MEFFRKMFLFFISLFTFAATSLYSLELHNLKLVFEIPEPDTVVGAPFGAIVSSGDINGDGFNDIAVGGGTAGNKRCIYIYYGGPTVDSIPDVTLVAEAEDAGYNFCLPEIGDINGDGYDDIIAVGGLYARVYFGGNPMDSLPDLKMYKYCDTGINWKCGDLNNDGYDDWILGEYAWDSGRGKISIYFGSTNPDTIPDITLTGEEGNFGGGIQSGYDVNGDGYDDLFISAIGYGPFQGKTYIYFGGNPMDTVPDVVMLGPRAGDLFGETIALVPDLNGDGCDEACVGEVLSGIHDTVFTYWGGNSMDSSIDMIFSDSGAYFGFSICGAEKINSRGEKALIVGAPLYPIPSAPKGRIYVYTKDSLLDTTIDAYAEGDSGQGIGCTVTTADIDGDSIEEIMFSNFFINNTALKVWVCKYTDEGVEENSNLNNLSTTLKASQNPFIKSTTLKYSLPSETKVSLNLYDISGRCVKTLVDGIKKQGTYKEELQSTGLSGGIYFVKFTAGDYKETKKLILMK